MEQLIADLQNTANKLRALWGNNPDSELIEKAIEALSAPQPEPIAASTQPKAARQTKKD